VTPVPLVSTVEVGPVPLQAKVAFLRDARSYPDRPSAVEAVETHMSWVFLTDRHAYKLKKPVRFDSLDFTTLEARRRFCAEEVRLNRQLAEGVYLDTLPLVVTSSGELVIGGEGEVVDWLVLMRRLPLAARLDTLIPEHRVDRDRLVAAVRLVSAFYAAEAPLELDRGAYRARLQRAIERNRVVLALPGRRLAQDTIARVVRRQLDLVARLDGPLAARAGRVIDTHGDLRPEHVYLLDPPVIVDRLDFDRDLRLLDPADELAFLVLECHRLGAPWVGPVVFDVYDEVTGDRPPVEVLAFYRSLRACMRARLAIGHLDSPDGAAASTWHAVAADYLELADTATLAFATA
jgi:aminoglycoside phosphotransferase family enzyme